MPGGATAPQCAILSAMTAQSLTHGQHRIVNFLGDLSKVRNENQDGLPSLLGGAAPHRRGHTSSLPAVRDTLPRAGQADCLKEYSSMGFIQEIH